MKSVPRAGAGGFATQDDPRSYTKQHEHIFVRFRAYSWIAFKRLIDRAANREKDSQIALGQDLARSNNWAYTVRRSPYSCKQNSAGDRAGL
jgi:hypothetical protein